MSSSLVQGHLNPCSPSSPMLISLNPETPPRGESTTTLKTDPHYTDEKFTTFLTTVYPKSTTKICLWMTPLLYSDPTTTVLCHSSFREEVGSRSVWDRPRRITYVKCPRTPVRHCFKCTRVEDRVCFVLYLPTHTLTLLRRLSLDEEVEGLFATDGWHTVCNFRFFVMKQEIPESLPLPLISFVFHTEPDTDSLYLGFHLVE